MRVEHEPILFDPLLTDIPEHADNRLDIIRHPREQIDVASWAVRSGPPHSQHQRSFEHKPIGMR
jgi:hypothetical protein